MPVSQSFEGYSAIPESFRSKLELRAKQIASSNEEEKEKWHRKWKRLVLERGHARLLDPDIHPEQIADFLKEETPAVQAIIEKNLPTGLAEKVAIVLRSSTLFSYVKRGKHNNDSIDAPEALVEVIKSDFLSHFVSSDQLVTERRYDRFSMTRLGNLIWRLGLTEIRRAFFDTEVDDDLLRRFDPEIRDDILAIQLGASENTAKRISVAKTFVLRSSNSASTSDDRIRMIGLQVLAVDLRQRERQASRFSIQKLPKVVGDELASLIEEPVEFGDIELTVLEELERAAVSIEQEFNR